jgi:hypothetical protein
LIKNFLDKAEGLLNEVTNAISGKAETNHINSDLEPTKQNLQLESIGRLPTVNFHNLPNPTSFRNPDIDDIDWLIRGVPEMYEDNPEIEDIVVEKLLAEGGAPPSQLIFPSLYEVTQRVMDKLLTVNSLKLDIFHLSIFSAKNGIRRNCSFFLVKPPKGCTLDFEPSYQTIPLPELRETYDQMVVSNSLSKRQNKKPSLKDYFVGNVDINKSLMFQVTMSNAVALEWISGANDESNIVIELHSYLYPPLTTQKKLTIRSKTFESMCFGSVKIPVRG